MPEYVCTCGSNEYCAADDCHGATAATVEPEIEVSAETLAQLRYIARKLDCNVQAALEEVVREFSTIQSEAVPDPGNGDLGEYRSPEATAEVDGSNPSGTAS